MQYRAGPISCGRMDECRKDMCNCDHQTSKGTGKRTQNLAGTECSRVLALGRYRYARHGTAHSKAYKTGSSWIATATISLREAPTASESDIVPVPTGIVVPKIRVVPSPPTLLSLSTSSSNISDTQHQAIRDDFEKGWNEGLVQLAAVKSRLYQSWRNGVRVMRMTADAGGHGLDGLEAIELENVFHSHPERDVPVLCLAGPGTSGEHVEGCSHKFAWDVWDDTI